jgi:hypothetical protein
MDLDIKVSHISQNSNRSRNVMNVSLLGTLGITIGVDARCRGTQCIASILPSGKQRLLFKVFLKTNPRFA